MTVRLDEFQDDTIVLHFGGSAGSIDAYTLAEALIGFADTARAISATIEPGIVPNDLNASDGLAAGPRSNSL